MPPCSYRKKNEKVCSRHITTLNWLINRDMFNLYCITNFNLFLPERKSHNITGNKQNDRFKYINIRPKLRTNTNITKPGSLFNNRARKSRTTLQNKVRLKVLPEQLTLFVNTSVTFKKCIIQ